MYKLYIFIYIYLYLSLFIYIYLYLSLFIYIYLYLSIFIYVYLYLSIFIYIYLYLSMFIYIYLYLSIFIYIYLYLSIFIYIYLYLSIFIYIYLCLSVFICESNLVSRNIGRFLPLEYLPILAARLDYQRLQAISDPNLQFLTIKTPYVFIPLFDEKSIQYVLPLEAPCSSSKISMLSNTSFPVLSA